MRSSSALGSSWMRSPTNQGEKLIWCWGRTETCNNTKVTYNDNSRFQARKLDNSQGSPTYGLSNQCELHTYNMLHTEFYIKVLKLIVEPIFSSIINLKSILYKFIAWSHDDIMDLNIITPILKYILQGLLPEQST